MNLIPRFCLVEGDTGPELNQFHVTSARGVRPPVLAELGTGYSCWLGVAEVGAASDADPEILRQITATDIAGTCFCAWLSPTETLGLGAGEWRVGLELRNPSIDPPLVHERQFVIEIRAGVVPADTGDPAAAAGALDFSYPSQSGLLALILEDF